MQTHSQTTVLVIGDDQLNRLVLRASLPLRGFAVIEAATAEAGLKTLQEKPVDVVILDLGLPDADGLALLSHIHTNFKIPIVIVSNSSSVMTKIEALEGGAADYVTKPFYVDELTARLRAALRHRPQGEGTAPVFRNGELVVDIARRRITRGPLNIKVSPTEFAILRLLLEHAGEVLTHDQILQKISKRGRNVAYLRVYMHQLRKRIEADPRDPQYIVTVTGVGYQLLTADTEPPL